MHRTVNGHLVQNSAASGAALRSSCLCFARHRPNRIAADSKNYGGGMTTVIVLIRRGILLDGRYGRYNRPLRGVLSFAPKCSSRAPWEGLGFWG